MDLLHLALVAEGQLGILELQIMRGSRQGAVHHVFLCLARAGTLAQDWIRYVALDRKMLVDRFYKSVQRFHIILYQVLALVGIQP